jgi:hypothetical protein
MLCFGKKSMVIGQDYVYFSPGNPQFLAKIRIL